ncbi:MAG: AlpA family transcriptional regulator [Burkholderiales bacterium]|nr:AlpA family transcriptional regulator [Burkholderiales bacterium]
MLQIHRLPQVAAALGLSRSTVWLRVKQGQCPPPVRLGSRAVGWPSSEIEALNAARVAGKTDDEIRELVTKLVIARQLVT